MYVLLQQCFIHAHNFNIYDWLDHIEMSSTKKKSLQQSIFIVVHKNWIS